MKRILKLSIILLLLPVLLVVPSSKNTTHRAPDCRFVTQVDVTLSTGTDTLQRTYTQSGKISSVLNYLRTTKPHGRADTDPERISGDSYKIVLHFSDGSRQIYRQRSYRYFSKNDHPWEQIDASHARLLYPLIQLLPSDV